MKTYARIQDGVFVELIGPEVYDSESPTFEDGEPSRIGEELPIGERFTPWFVGQLVDITDVEPGPKLGWTYDGSTFSPPVPYQPTPEEILSQNQLRQAAFKTTASIAMTPYMLSLNLGNATEEETALARVWQAYYRALDLVDITSSTPDWPVAPA